MKTQINITTTLPLIATTSANQQPLSNLQDQTKITHAISMTTQTPPQSHTNIHKHQSTQTHTNIRPSEQVTIVNERFFNIFSPFLMSSISIDHNLEVLQTPLRKRHSLEMAIKQSQPSTSQAPHPQNRQVAISNSLETPIKKARLDSSVEILASDAASSVKEHNQPIHICTKNSWPDNQLYECAAVSNHSKSETTSVVGLLASHPKKEQLEDFFNLLWRKKITQIIILTSDNELSDAQSEYMPYFKTNATYGCYHVNSFNTGHAIIGHMFDTSQKTTPCYSEQYHMVIAKQIAINDKELQYIDVIHIPNWDKDKIPTSQTLEAIVELAAHKFNANPDNCTMLIHANNSLERPGTLLAAIQLTSQLGQPNLEQALHDIQNTNSPVITHINQLSALVDLELFYIKRQELIQQRNHRLIKLSNQFGID